MAIPVSFLRSIVRSFRLGRRLPPFVAGLYVVRSSVSSARRNMRFLCPCTFVPKASPYGPAESVGNQAFFDGI